MKKMSNILFILAFTGFAMAQSAPASTPDSMQWPTSTMMKDGKCRMMAPSMPGQCAGAMANAQCRHQMLAGACPGMPGQCGGGMENAQCFRHMQLGACQNTSGCPGAACRGPMFPGHRLAMFLAAKMVFGMLFLGMMLMCAVNILLTIIIGMDMKKRGTFNGLWIPLLLIAGIPVSIIYAIFRLGDVMGEKK
jgi:hypothetical protein